MKLSRKRFFFIAAMVVFVVLAWPVETWLEYREKQAQRDGSPDAIYLVAGSIDQDRRIEALMNFYSNLVSNAGSASAPAHHSSIAPMLVLVGNDRLKSRWSSEDQANLTRAEWGVKIIRGRIQNSVFSNQLEIVPGKFGGTDGEMEALGNYLWNHRELKRLVVVTSPFHVRRTLNRLAIYQPPAVDVGVVTSKAKWTDYAPWTVLGELFKMGRDLLGLSRVPWLSRRVR